MRNVTRRDFLKVTAAGAAVGAAAELLPRSMAAGIVVGPKPGGAYRSRFETMYDRVWLGPDLWANPMEDWHVRGGRVECLSAAPNRNVHSLTCQLGKWCGSFKMTVRVGKLTGKTGSAGFLIGVHDNLNDYRGNVFFGSGVTAVITTGGELILGKKKAKLDTATDLSDVTLHLEAVCGKGEATMILAARDTKSGKRIGSVTANVDETLLVGNLALAHNPPVGGSAVKGKAKGKGGRAGGGSNARFWFNDWTIEGDKIAHSPAQTFGPILWAMHTLDDRGGKQGHVMKMTAQMPPMGAQDSQTVRLEVREAGAWKRIAEEKIDPDARTATFRVARWPADKDVPYRLAYTQKRKGADSVEAHWKGAVRKDPAGSRPLKVAKFTCQMYRGFPYAPLVANVARTDPDMMVFSGDQIYESTGGYGIIREPAMLSILNYLRKWYLFGWAFGELMRDRPTVCIPDDHDVFHGNLWGEGGMKMKGGNTSTDGGYRQPAQMVNAVHRTQTAHLPDPFDPTPCLQDISVYYCSLVYGRTSFAIIADRQFKSSPGHVDTGGGRADWVKGPNFDVAALDKPGLKLLGERQMKFLEHWVADWRGADMKMIISQTVWSNAATNHGGINNVLQADLDSCGWPQTARDAAVRLARKGFPLHVSGDQHLASLIQYGADEQRDAHWSFCTPAICSTYQRWWKPDVQKFPYANRPAHGLDNTGEYLDGFGNLMYVYAVGNPKGTGAGTADRYEWTESRAGGFGIVTVDTDDRTYKVDCYRFLADLDTDGAKAQFAGWPLTINQRDNYGRKVAGYLPEVTYEGKKNPVLKVADQKTGELVYAIRLKGNRVKPWVFEEGTYTVRLGDPETGKWETFKGQKIETKP